MVHVCRSEPEETVCGGDTYITDLVEAADGTNVLGSNERYPSIELSETLGLRPDLIFLSARGIAPVGPAN
jgi:ABC-type Fe3+-hydroxamate transport system substrate-binding protein